MLLDATIREGSSSTKQNLGPADWAARSALGRGQRAVVRVTHLSSAALTLHHCVDVLGMTAGLRLTGIWAT